MTTKKPMQSPATQPIGFWTVRAGEAIRTRTRGALHRIGVSQPEWWVLHQLSLHPTGVERSTVVDTIGPNDTPAIINTAIDSAVDKRWIDDEEERLTYTELGEKQFRRAFDLQQELQAERMQGISADDYVTTIRVLQRTTANVGGSAWHW
ncbi:MarR family winged helix-turn-helix transcriptional regulator [Rhodococcus sp. G-MC3]|uniref:MarR family winged helix-turn-helix transcriptional regulator n=1 Tax=Rhodococcus sp. G-MC3 TaxID=3046209 RepID=UPI0024B9BE27|nr:MarR family winged helix-turn-helix transcriptional regulator [Rhodococcus sp. G-MC3]MDJ0395543.1 MarR family winged helix-turn-helix transcriptional regulator [Rhodococcus sp. G-MC3]